MATEKEAQVWSIKSEQGGDAVMKEADNNTITTLANWEVDEATPLVIQNQQDCRFEDRESSKWVQQNLIKLSKLLGIDFQRHEEEAIELLLQVDSCRQVRRMEAESAVRKNNGKGMQELKNLVSFDVKFKNSEPRNRGRKILENTSCNAN